jgi:hypothetical protein
MPNKEPTTKTTTDDIPAELRGIVTEYMDVFPEKLYMGLPPKREVDPKLELKEGAKPPVSRIYRMSYSELDKLKKQLQELIDGHLIEPSKSPYGALVLFAP